MKARTKLLLFGALEEGDDCPECRRDGTVGAEIRALREEGFDEAKSLARAILEEPKRGTLYFPPVENCSCHLGHPPCSACVGKILTCRECGWEDEREDE